MTRHPVSIHALNLFIADRAKVTEECAQCKVGTVARTAYDPSGCNWNVSRIDGGHCGDCFAALRSVIDDLRARFELAPDAAARTTMSHRADP